MSDQTSFIDNTPITAELLAKRLHGRERGAEMRKEEELAARDAWLVVVFGASDDLMEFRGAIDDEAGCNNGRDVLIGRAGPIAEHEDCECEYCGYEDAARGAPVIAAVWDEGGYSWQYRTKLPHSSFDILEGNTKYCRGIVFNLFDINDAFTRGA